MRRHYESNRPQRRTVVPAPRADGNMFSPRQLAHVGATALRRKPGTVPRLDSSALTANRHEVMRANTFIVRTLISVTATGLRAASAGSVARKPDSQSMGHAGCGQRAQEPLSACKSACYRYCSAKREEGHARPSAVGSGPGSAKAAVADFIVVPSHVLAALSPRFRNLVALLSYCRGKTFVALGLVSRSLVAFLACLTLADRVDCGRIS